MSTSFVTEKNLEVDSTLDSFLWEAVWLRDGSSAAVVWSDVNRTNYYLTLVAPGGGVGTKVTLAGLTGDANTDAHAAAVGTNRVAVVTEGGAGAPALHVYDTAGTLKGSVAYASGTDTYDVTGLSDGSFIVKWHDAASGARLYTRYTQDGVAMPGQTAKPLNSSAPYVANVPETFAADNSGGFLYSSRVSSNGDDGAYLKYVSNTGAETLIATVPFGYRGALAYDGTSYWYFYNVSGGADNQIFMQKVVAGTGLVGPAIGLIDEGGAHYESRYVATVKALPNGTFLLNDYDGQHALIVNSTGAVIDSYLVSGTALGKIVPTPDSGALWIENWPPSGDGAQQWDMKVGELHSVYLDPGPTVTIIADTTTLKAGQHATITFTFSQEPVGFDVSDITYSGGSITALTMDSADHKKYTATFTPSATQSLAASISMAAGAIKNSINLGNSASDAVAITGDTLAPTVSSLARLTPASAITNSDTLVFHVTFSEAVSNLDATDFTVTGGTTATVTAVNPAGANAWDVTVSGGDLASFNGSVTLGIKGGNNLADAAGNALNGLGPTASYTVDNVVAAPGLTLPADVGASNSDGITKNAVVNVTLAADKASWEYSTDGGASWTPGSGTSFTLAENTYAIGAIQVRQTDTAGNQSTVTSNTTQIQVDTTALMPSFTMDMDTSVNGDGISANGAFTVTLPGDAASWQYSTNGGTSWNSGSGTTFNLSEGTYAIGAVKVRYTDTAGNTSSAASNAAAITIDTTALAPALTFGADSGSNTSDGITKNATVNVSLAADVASWQYSVDNGGTWNSGSGASFTLAEGEYAAGAIQVRQTDKAGNESIAAANPSWLKIDTTVDTPSFSLANDSGTSATDGITSDGAVNVTLSPEKDSWEYSVDGGAHWTGGTGASFALSAGHYAAGAVQVRQTDLAGNTSTAYSNATDISIDNTAAAPSMALATDTGSSGTDGFTKDGTVNVNLAADVATWEYSLDAGGNWIPGTGTSFTLDAGTYAAGSVQVRYTDAAGNQSSASFNAVTFNVDNSVAAPILTLAQDTGESGTDGITKTPTMNVLLAVDAASWQYSVDGGGSWSAGTGNSFTLANGTYAAGSVQVRQTDIAGNVSTTTANTSAIQIISTAGTVSFMLANDTGAADRITQDGLVNVSLPAESSSWKYSLDGGSGWTNGSGASFTLPEGAYGMGMVVVSFTDKAGNVGTTSNPSVIVVDHTAPPAPTVALAVDNGSSTSDGITSNPNINVTLAGDAAKWEYSVDGGATWNNGTGNSFVLADGSYAAGSVQARQTDIAGNVSPAGSNALALVVDTGAAPPSFLFANDTGTSDSDGLSNDGTVSVAMPTDMASWEYSVDGGAHWTAGIGTSFELAEGVHGAGTVQVRYVDTSGNQSAAATNTSSLAVDKTVAAPTLALPADNGASASDGLTSNTSVTVTLATDAASWEYRINGGAWTTGTGTSFTLADGVYAAGSIQVRQTDAAGNLSAAGVSASAITVDTTALSPSFALALDSGNSSTDGITNNGTMQVALPGDADSWQYSVDGGAHWTAGAGTSFALAAGTYGAGQVQVRYIDKAGNQSTAIANAAGITVDDSVAAPSLSLGADTGSSASDGITMDASASVTLATDAASWQYSVDGGAHWTTGSGDSFVLADGSYAAGAVKVRQTDLAGNLSAAASNAAPITVDTTALGATFALATDTGRSASDGISTNGAVNVTLPADMASWEYSIDAGASWSTGAASSFTLAEGSYATGTVQVRYIDKAGNHSAASSNATPLSIDNAAPAASLALRSDSGPNTTDGVTNDPRINVSLPADVASWEYSADGGAHWTAGTGNGFNLAAGAYDAGTLQVRYTDLAGNHSPVAASGSAVTILAVSSPETPPVVIDGVPVQTGTVTNADGSTSEVMVVSVVQPGRVDSSGQSTVADIPLGTSGGNPVLMAQLPLGFGLQVRGSLTPQPAGSSLDDLLREIQSHTSGGSADQAAMMAGGTGFLGQLSSSAPILVQSVTPTVGSGPTSGAPLVLSGSSQPGAPATALVIDAHNLPSGTTIQLQDVSFAAVAGEVRLTGGAGSQTVWGDGASQYMVLGPDDDVLHGGAGNDIVGSEGGNDKIYGDDGNDLVFGGAGNDTIDGGAGTDTVLLQGASRADYHFRFDHGTLVATHLNGGADGEDTIANVEVLRFGGAQPDMGAEATVRRLYDTLFDRAADAQGSAYWSAANAHGMSMHDIAASLLGSGEAGSTAALANAAFVNKLYHDALGSLPLPADDLAKWTTQLDQGKADRAEVLLGIANSTQKLTLDAQEHSDIAFAATDAATVVRLYQTMFGRHADEAGVNYWIERTEAGMATRDVAGEFLKSAEGQEHYGGKSSADFIEALYNIGLGRDCSTEEEAYWVGILDHNALTRMDVIMFFANSAEQVALVGNSTTLPLV